MNLSLTAHALTSAHTPTPWVIDPKFASEVQTPDLQTVCSVWHEHADGMEITVTGVNQCSLNESAANAAFIVKCVNAHDDLVSALKQAKELARVAEGMTGCRSDDEWVWGIQKTIDAALEKAGVK